MNTRWITDFRALRTLLPVVAESDSYDHDAVSNEELDELFAGVEAESSTPEVNVPPRGPDKSPVAAAAEHVALPQTDAREESPNVEVPRGGIAVEEGPADIPDMDEAWLDAAPLRESNAASDEAEFDFQIVRRSVRERGGQ